MKKIEKKTKKREEKKKTTLMRMQTLIATMKHQKWMKKKRTK